jgi:uncharacterized protein YkwD
LPHSLSNALGFLTTAVIIEVLLGLLFSFIYNLIPKSLKNFKGSKYLAVIPALGEGLVIVAFVLTLVLALPVAPTLKAGITDSKIGSSIVQRTSAAEKNLSEVFGGVVEDALTYLTIEPGSNQNISLNIASENLTVDQTSEEVMFRMVNEERLKAGIATLSSSQEIATVSRAYAYDMWKRHYFSHYSPEGQNVGNRFENAEIRYTFAGENLALAPTLTLAMNGLMNSEGHRANILNPRFKKIGIGVVDNGVYGKIFVQEFTD